MRAALYARTSTDDGRQELENQMRELRSYAAQMGWNVVSEYLDQISGRKVNRPQFQQAMNDARKRRFDVLLFWSMDRLSREGALKTLQTLNALTEYGVKYRSLQEAYIDTLGPFGDAVIGLIATVAKMEAERTSARVKAGLARVRAQGIALGRRRIVMDSGKIAEMHTQGLSLREIADTLGTSAMTVQRRLRAAARP
jgi:DNA invertase Pin-like site-specific DNA recombinase